MKRFVPRIAAVLFLVVAGTLAPASAEDRPFKASGQGLVAHNSYQDILIGRGEATHLGRTFLRVDLDSGFLDSGIFIPSVAGSLTSASGELLYFHFDKEFYIFDTATGVVSATLTFTGAFSTGRFQDATGSADVMFVFDPNSGYQSFRFLIDGSIDY